jgi:hypothetical protein
MRSVVSSFSPIPHDLTHSMVSLGLFVLFCAHQSQMSISDGP